MFLPPLVALFLVLDASAVSWFQRNAQLAADLASGTRTASTRLSAQLVSNLPWGWDEAVLAPLPVHGVLHDHMTQ